MKINLTRLLEIKSRFGDDEEFTDTDSTSYTSYTFEATSSEKAYSFELEKESFILDNK